MKISKSKRQLAQLLIDAGVTQFPEGANWAAQDGDDGRIFFYEEKPFREKYNDFWGVGNYVLTQRDAPFGAVIPNWHQTALSRDEFDWIVAESAKQSKLDADGWIEWNGGERPTGAFAEDVDAKLRGGEVITKPAGVIDWCHLDNQSDVVAYRLHKPEQAEQQLCESVTRTIPEPVTAPILDRLLQDYRNAADFATRKQTEADEAAKMRDERWKAVQARAGEFGVHVSVDAEIRESEPVITDWRDLRVGDIVWVGGSQNKNAPESGEYEISVIRCDADEASPLGLAYGLARFWPNIKERGWRFIRRP